MEISVQNLWIAYLVTFIGLSVILCLVVKKSGGVGYSLGVLLSAILAGLLVYLLAINGIDLSTMSATDRNSLDALYLTMLVLIILIFLWTIIELAVKSKHAYKGFGTRNHTKAECDEDGCKATSFKTNTHNKDGSMEFTDYDCDEEGICTPSSFYMRDKEGNTLNISYLA